MIVRPRLLEYCSHSSPRQSLVTRGERNPHRNRFASDPGVERVLYAFTDQCFARALNRLRGKKLTLYRIADLLPRSLAPEVPH
jgi:hypothetical protein